MDFRKYRPRPKDIIEMADWHPRFDMTGVVVNINDRKAGSPKLGDKIARHPPGSGRHEHLWLIPAATFAAKFEPVSDAEESETVRAQAGR